MRKKNFEFVDLLANDLDVMVGLVRNEACKQSEKIEKVNLLTNGVPAKESFCGVRKSRHRICSCFFN